MRISAQPPVSGSASSVRRAGASSGSFRLNDTGSAAAKTSVSAAFPASGIDGILALQSEADAAERRQRAARRGTQLLDALDGLKVAVLSGRISGEALSQLRLSLAERRDLTDDPRLDDILAHIDLRAQVELAKLGR